LNTPALLMLEDGTPFYGQSIGVIGSAVGEVVFNTAMTGYQEILTDPSYAQQMVTLTCPHIGNVGCNPEDQESAALQVRALILRNVPLLTSNFRAQEGLIPYLKRHQIVAIADIDTRQLTHRLRQRGAMRGCIIAGDQPDASLALQRAQAFPGLTGLDLTSQVTTTEPYSWSQGTGSPAGGLPAAKLPQQLPYHVVVCDFGVKRTILRCLVDQGCHLTVVPAATSLEAILAYQPDGILLSNGPGDPQACGAAIQLVRGLLAHPIPLFGICLGHQLLALACGATTCKMKQGHHGSNHPVRDSLGRVLITSQNHEFTVEESTLPAMLQATHWSLFDGSLQGLQHQSRPAFSFQGHPEAAPGPQDATLLFAQFMTLMKRYRQQRQ
jgi:carbamoyl-phosphate synthase small subunit